MWKVVVVIINHQFTSSVTFHEILHSFRAGRGTGTASLEAKGFKKLSAMMEEVLYEIFLDLHKA